MRTFARLTLSGTALPVIEVRAWIRRAVLAMQVASERQDLATMDQRLLDDIGVTRAQADREAGREIWDLPAGR